ncbi:MAG: HD-GYP domain-containing protein [Desulfatibacillaceae bacterium]
MPRKSLADRIREAGSSTQRRLDESLEVMNHISEYPVESETHPDPHSRKPYRATPWEHAKKTRGDGVAADGTAAGESAMDLESGPSSKGGDLYRNLFSYYSNVLNLARQEDPFSIDEGKRLVEQVVDAMAEQESLYVKALYYGDPMEFVAFHSINVTIYLVKLSSGLGLSRDHQVEIGLAGLFHDIGKCRIPGEILYKQDNLTDKELALLRKSPIFGHEILKPFEGEHPHLAECALQAYERVDGSGYPYGLSGDEINEYAQIIGLVDVYEALTHSRPQRDKYPHFSAVKEIIRTWKKSFKRAYLKALLINFSVFPLNSYVQLNSEAIGRVVETYPDQPLRPRVQILFDSQKKRVRTERIVDLPQMPLLYIVDSVSEKDLERMMSS